MKKYQILDELDELPIYEKELRENLYALAVNILDENFEEMFSKELSIEIQFKDINTAINGSIEEVIKSLKLNYGLEVKIIDE